LLFAPRAAAQSGIDTDDAFLFSNATTQQANQNGHGLVLVVAGSSATFGSTQVGATKTYIKFQPIHRPLETPAQEVRSCVTCSLVSSPCL
jgi:hypothetical protein